MHGPSCFIIVLALVPLIAYLLIIGLTSLFQDIVHPVEEIVSHAFCHGSSHVDRRCTLKNVCYAPDTGLFIFFNRVNSTYHGVPAVRNDPAFVSLSSISYHNQYLFDYVDIHSDHSAYLAKNHRVKWINGVTHLYGRFKPDNLMHVLHDDIFPLFYSMQRQTEPSSERVFFLDQWSQTEPQPLSHCPVCDNAYKRFLPIDATSNYLASKNSLLCMDQVDIGVSRDTVWYDYGFYSPQRPVSHASIFLTETIHRMLQHINLSRVQCSSRPILFIVRSKIRLILNLQRILLLMTQYRLPYKTIEMEKYSDIVELIEEVRCARLIVGTHGSALSLASFLPQGSGLIEIFPFAIDPNNYTPYKTLCERLSLHYEAWSNVREENSVTHADRIPELGGLVHLPSNVRMQIQQSKSVPLHLCCSDAQWLYRINQDTIVDIDSFSQVLMSMVEKTKEISQGNNFTESIQRPLSPGKVESLDCTRNGTLGTITWREPWNLRFLSAKDNDTKGQVKYQVNILSNDTKNESNVSYTSVTQVTLPLPASLTSIWVRCIHGSVNGPYNNKAIKC